VDVGSSALSERGAVYGGAANLKRGLKNIIQSYGPTVIGLATTCLAETIGDDVPQIVREFEKEEPMATGVTIIQASTPSYAGSHEEGYVETLRAIIQRLAAKGERNRKFNLIIGAIVSPADIRYLKDLLECWCSEYILFPDISETLDAPLVKNLPRIAEGGTSLHDIRDMANSTETITIGGSIQAASAGSHLEVKYGVPHTALPLPIGIEYTDMLVAKLEEISGCELPQKYERERGRLFDAMVDAHKLVSGVRTAVYGDTEVALGITKALREVGMDPSVVATGTKNPAFIQRVKQISPSSTIMCGADFEHIHKEIIRKNIELMIGPSTGRQISQKENIPLLRVGLPNHDRFGAARQTILGYKGATWLIDAVANTLLEHI
jgi:nitrogenase molybdenum-iron protein NifN